MGEIIARLIGGTLGVGLFLGGIAYITESSVKTNLALETQRRHEAYEAGRAEATSNLVSAVNTLTERSRNELFLRTNGVVDNDGLTLENKIGYLTASFDTIMQLEKIRLDVNAHATEYATGKKQASTNDVLSIPSKCEIRINLGEFY